MRKTKRESERKESNQINGCTPKPSKVNKPTKWIVSNNVIVIYKRSSRARESMWQGEKNENSHDKSLIISYTQLPKWIWLTKIVQGYYDNNASNIKLGLFILPFFHLFREYGSSTKIISIRITSKGCTLRMITIRYERSSKQRKKNRLLRMTYKKIRSIRPHFNELMAERYGFNESTTLYIDVIHTSLISKSERC